MSVVLLVHSSVACRLFIKLGGEDAVFYSQLASEVSCLLIPTNLIIPSFNPAKWAQGTVGDLELSCQRQTRSMHTNSPVYMQESPRPWQ
jgi:hypothetical protein